MKKNDVSNNAERIVFPFPSGELLSKGLEALGFPEDDGLYRTVGIRGRKSINLLVSKYLKELELFNAVFDLVGAESGTEQGRSDLVVRHILDSLAPWKEIASLIVSCGESSGAGYIPEIADAGSGAGFPGIPLAIIFPGVHFTLVERMSKRCAFLENCKAIMGLKNVSVFNSEVENASAGFFDIVVFRAFRPLDLEMTSTLLRMLKIGAWGTTVGKLAAWKARKDKIDAEMAAITDIVKSFECIRLEVPYLAHEERHLVVIP
jgi:16S rRNA (guanine527-N7)-methyltransferase